MPARFNPLKGLSNPREVWAWGMYDFANQSFTLLIITLLFSLYFKDVVVGGDRGTALWSVVHGSSYVIVVICSPFLGAIGDARKMRKQILVLTGLCCALLTCALGLIQPGWLLLAALLYIPANVCYQLGENFLASFLSDISTQRNIGRVSAIGWTMGYVGALCLLLLVAGAMMLFGLGETEKWRPFFVLAGVWFALGMIPAVLFLHEEKHEATERGPLAEGFRRVRDTLAHARQYKHLVRFLIAFLIYGFGVQVIIGFASIIAAKFGFGKTELVLFVLQITVTAGIAAAATSAFQDRIGAKQTVLVYLGVWIASALGLVVLASSGDPSKAWLWVIGNGLGLGLGGIGTSSRAMVGRFTPKQRTAEFFGLWGMTYKLAAAVGVFSFGSVSALLGDRDALILLALFFIAGALIMLTVDERAGLRAARRAERTLASATLRS